MGERIIIKLQGRNLHPHGMKTGELIPETCKELESGIKAGEKGILDLREILRTE